MTTQHELSGELSERGEVTVDCCSYAELLFQMKCIECYLELLGLLLEPLHELGVEAGVNQDPVNGR